MSSAVELWESRALCYAKNGDPMQIRRGEVNVSFWIGGVQSVWEWPQNIGYNKDIAT